MNTTVCPDEVRHDLASYCAGQEAQELDADNIWERRKENDPHAHLYRLCSGHVYSCERSRDTLRPVAWLVFPILLAALLSIVGVNWPVFVAAHPWWFVCVVLPVSTIATYAFTDWFTFVAWKPYAKIAFSRCRECREHYCAPYLLKQEKMRELRKRVVDIIIRDWDTARVREAGGMNEGMVLLQLHLAWNDYDGRAIVKDIFREIGKIVPVFVVDEVGRFPDPCTCRLTYNPVPVPKT